MLSDRFRPLVLGLVLSACTIPVGACGGDSVNPSNPDASNAKDSSSEGGGSATEGGTAGEGGGDGAAPQPEGGAGEGGEDAPGG